MIVFLENPKELILKTPGLISKCSRVAGYLVNIKKSLVFSNEQVKSKIKYTVPFALDFKKWSSYKSNKVCTNRYEENHRTVMNRIKSELNKSRESPCSRIGRLNSVKMSLHFSMIYRFNTILVKIPESLFDSKVYLERQKMQNSHHNIEGKEQSWKTDITWFQDLL